MSGSPSFLGAPVEGAIDHPSADPVLAALDDLETAVTDNMARSRMLVEHINTMRLERAVGRCYSDIVAGEERPRIVELATENLEALFTAGSRLRRVQALTLHDEGVTMDRIAEMFGVTRQRISALIKEANAAAF
jgi:hypothetical protein